MFKFANQGTMILDTSTISPTAAKELHLQASEHDMKFLDTPMAGGTGGAQAGTLTFMVGAQSVEDFDKAKILLEAVG